MTTNLNLLVLNRSTLVKLIDEGPYEFVPNMLIC
jgi:hypothetical protein